MAWRVFTLIFGFAGFIVSAQETNTPAFRLGIDVLADGGFKEPDEKWGHAYLEALRDALKNI